VKRIKHNDLTHYFLRPHSELPRAYLASCEKFFNTFHSVDNEKFKRQASSLTGSKPDGTSRIIKEKENDS
jgi:hypothetical protein